jgi:TonB-dependent receptor
MRLSAYVLCGVSAAALLTGIAVAAESDDPNVEVVRIYGVKQNDVVTEKMNDIRTSSVMSQEEIQRAPAGSIVDVVSHLPGVTAYSDMGQGMAATGEHEFLTLRGMDSSYNAYLINGVQVPVADPNTRALSLRMVSPSSIALVKVNKTPLAEDDGAAIGGIVDLKTPSAFNYDGLYVKGQIGANMALMAKDRGADWAGGSSEFALADRFGSNFGVYASGYYDLRNTVGETIEALGYAPTQESEAKVTDYSKITGGLSPVGVRFDYYENLTRRYGGTLSLDYKTEDLSLFLRSTYGRYETRGNDNQFAALGSMLGAMTGASDYTNGVISGTGVRASSYYQTRDGDDQLFTVQAGGSATAGRWTLDANINYGLSDSSTPYYVEASFYEMPKLDGSATFNTSDPEHIVITTDSAATSSFLYSPSTAKLWKYQGRQLGSSNQMYGLKLDTTFDAKDGILDSIKFGVNANSSDRDQYNHYFFHNNDNFVIQDSTGTPAPWYNPAGPTIAEMPGRVVSDAFSGQYLGMVKAYDRSYFLNAVLPYKYTNQFAGNGAANPGTYTATDYNGQTVLGKESIVAGYAEGTLKLGDFSAMPGLRYEYTAFHETHWVSDTKNANTGYFTSTSHNYGELLPSLYLTYRPQDSQLVYRASVRRSFSRPAFGLIAAPESISYDATTGASSTTKGNPDLKPTEATNYDIGAEYYGANGFRVEANGYYKHLKNFIYTASATGESASANSGTVNLGSAQTSTPENGGDADLYGMELNARYSLANIYAPLDGVGINGNLTWQHSSADSKRADHNGRKTDLPRSPGFMYNLGLTYDHGQVSADLTYQYVGRQLLSLTSYNLDMYLQPVQELNLNVSYRWDGFDLGFQASNLLDDPLFYKTFGKSTTYLGTQSGGGNGSYVKTGPMLRVTLGYQL